MPFPHQRNVMAEPKEEHKKHSGASTFAPKSLHACTDAEKKYALAVRCSQHYSKGTVDAPCPDLRTLNLWLALLPDK